MRAENLTWVIDDCIHKRGFIIETREDRQHLRETYGIVCGRAEEFHNGTITQPYTVWRLQQ